MIALVDCNSFFCSVEKVFHPGLNGKPVCVLSCNDGCIVALTPEAKALGLHRGDPIFKKKDIVQHYEVKLFSTNMMLYAAMSKRINNILRASVPRSEVYSIDESFLYLDGLEKYHNLEDYMRGVVEKVQLYTDIPVSVGIAPTKTLAKINYIDFYRAKTAQGAGKSSQQTADDFGYAKNRTFVVTKAMNLVSRLDTEHIRNCLDILFNADLALKTSAINYRTVLEETIVKLSPEKIRRSYY